MNYTQKYNKTIELQVYELSPCHKSLGLPLCGLLEYTDDGDGPGSGTAIIEIDVNFLDILMTIAESGDLVEDLAYDICNDIKTKEMEGIEFDWIELYFNDSFIIVNGELHIK